jgi:hypothetical protein
MPVVYLYLDTFSNAPSRWTRSTIRDDTEPPADEINHAAE